jgi:uncharacterized protein with FMN-binding domain
VRRTAVTIIATIVGLVLLLQFKTHPVGGSSGGLASLGTVPVTSPSPRTKASPQATHQPGVSSSPSSPTRTPSRSSSSGPSAATKKPTQAAAPKTVTATGQTIHTRYGPVQVRITETSGRLTNVVAIQLPGSDSHSTQIAAYAAPLLRSEALKAGSAHIDVVSGATYTSDGYAQSLQSALDNA